jgi:hypothetical protein
MKNDSLCIIRQIRFNQNTCSCNNVIRIVHNSWSFTFWLKYICYCSPHNSRVLHLMTKSQRSKYVMWNKPQCFDVLYVTANSRALDNISIVSRHEQEENSTWLLWYLRNLSKFIFAVPFWTSTQSASVGGKLPFILDSCFGIYTY